MFDDGPKRLNKYIAESGICSRRDADRFIESGAVFVNGRRAEMGTQVMPGDRVKVNGRDIAARQRDDIVLIALNKPVGVECTTDPEEPDNIVDFVNHPTRLFPIGRLDKDSQGLILLTNDGDIVNRILRAGNEHEKEYLVTVDKPVTDAFVVSMARPVPILGTHTKKCVVEKTGEHTFRIVLVQGLNRQIRRMCEHFGYEVTKLVRTRIMNIALKGLPEGDWRDVTDAEKVELARLIRDSAGTADGAATQAGKGQTAKQAPKASAPKPGASKPAPRPGTPKPGTPKPGAPKPGARPGARPGGPPPRKRR